eukprot:2457792-Heterocapsa_arctica.AAC.1
MEDFHQLREFDGVAIAALHCQPPLHTKIDVLEQICPASTNLSAAHADLGSALGSARCLLDTTEFIHAILPLPGC